MDAKNTFLIGWDWDNGNVALAYQRYKICKRSN